MIPRRLLVLSVLFFCAACNSTPRSQTAFIDQAQRLHATALASASREPAPVADYLQKIVRRLHDAAKAVEPKKAGDPLLARLQAHVIPLEIPTAATTGGAHMYLSSGLVKLAESEEELASMVAHQFAHAMNLDVQNTKMRPLPADPPPPPARLVGQFINFRLTPAQEQAADDLAFRLYARAGWDPAKFGGWMARLSGADARPPQAGQRSTADRLAWAKDRAAKVSVEERMLWRKETIADEDTFQERRDQAARLLGPLPPNLNLLVLALPNCALPADRPEQTAAQDELRRILAPPVGKEPS